MSQQIVADESVDFRLVLALRKHGVQVYSILQNQASIRDEEVLAIAVSNKALLITEDKDFGDLVFRLQLNHCGVLLLRFEDKKAMIETTVETIVKYYDRLLDKFSVLTKHKLRIKE